MPLEEKLLENLKCCLHDDGHVVIEPLQLKCGGVACQTCVTDKKATTTKCFECKKEHSENDFINTSPNKIAQILIEVNVKDIFKYLKENFTH